MRYIKHFVLTVLTFFCVFANANIDRVVIVVNDDALTDYDVEKFRKATLFFVPEKSRDKAALELDHKINDMLIERTLLLQYAQRSGVSPTKEQVQSFKMDNLSRMGITAKDLPEKLNMAT